MSKNFLLSILVAAAAIGFATVPVAAAEDLALTSDSASQSISGDLTDYANVSVADGVNGTITFEGGDTEGNNMNLLVETSVSIGTGSTLEIRQATCDLISIYGITGAGTLTLSKVSPAEWGGATVIGEDGSGFTGTINVWNGATATNGDAYSQGLYLNSENAAKNATIALGNYSSLIISTGATTVAGINSTNANAKVTSAECNCNVNLNYDNPYNYASTEAFWQNGATTTETARTLTISGSGTYSYSGDFGSAENYSSLNLVKSGTGTQKFSGAFYAGTVSVESGTLDLSGATVKVGSTITNAGTVTLSNTTLFDLSGMTPAEGNVYTVISSSAGGTISGFESISINNFLNVSGRSTVENIDNSIIFTAGAAANLTWTGGTTWDTASQNWTNSGTSDADKFYTGDSVTFGAIGAGAVAVASAGVSAGTMTVSGGEYTFTGGAISASSLSIETAGTATIAGSGAVTIGTLNGSGAVTFAGTGTLTLTGIGDYSGEMQINSGTVDLAAGGQDGALRGSIVVNEGAELKLSAGDATGWGGNCVSGLQILGGTLNITTTGGSGQNQTFNNLAIKLTGGTITGVSGFSFDFFGGSSSVETYASATTSTISNGLVCIRQNEGATFTVADGDAEIDLLVSAKVSNTNSGSDYGAHSLIKEGAGTMSLTGANDYSGATQINAGTLVAGNNSAFGTGTVSVASGAKLQIASGVKLSGVSEVTLADGAKLVVDLSGKTSATETFVIDLISSTAISVAGANLTAGDVTGTMAGKYELLGWDKTDWVESWSYANNTLSLTMTAAIPEPSLFGVLAGLGALALVGTRRRRRK